MTAFRRRSPNTSSCRRGVPYANSPAPRAGSTGHARSDPDLSAEDVALGYKNLLEAERCFRDLKSTLDLRPVYHRIEPPIRAHVRLCWLALLLIRIAERRTAMTWRCIAIELGRVHAVTLTSSAGTVVQTTPLNNTQQGIVDACGMTAPPRVTHLHTT